MGAVWLQIYHMCHFLNVCCYLFQWHALLRRRLDIFFAIAKYKQVYRKYTRCFDIFAKLSHDRSFDGCIINVQ